MNNMNSVMNQLSQERIEQFKEAIDKVKKDITEAEELLQELEQDYSDLEKAAAYGPVPPEMKDKRNIDDQKLTGKFLEIGTAAITDYNNLGGIPPHHVKKGMVSF